MEECTVLHGKNIVVRARLCRHLSWCIPHHCLVRADGGHDFSRRGKPKCCGNTDLCGRLSDSMDSQAQTTRASSVDTNRIRSARLPRPGATEREPEDIRVVARDRTDSTGFLCESNLLHRASATCALPLFQLRYLPPWLRSMHSFDLSDIDMPASGSRLLSEATPDISSSSSRTGHGGDDLSLSELSTGRPQSKSAHRRPFSLLAQPRSRDESAIVYEDAEEDEGGQDQTMTQEEIEKARKAAAKTREEKLQHDLFVLKKLNAAFEVYKDALRETKSSTDVSIHRAMPCTLLLICYDIPLAHFNVESNGAIGPYQRVAGQICPYTFKV